MAKKGISRTVSLITVIIVLVVAAVLYVTISAMQTSSTSSTTISTTTMSTATSSISSTTSQTGTYTSPQTLIYETYSTMQYLDPQVSYDIFGASVEQNVYEPLLWYNGTNGQVVVPWLAKSYTISPDGRTMTITLRQGIKFADGVFLNSSAVYFSFNRLLVMDGSAPVGHGTQASWILQQLLNTSLSTTLCSCNQVYGKNYVDAVLKENFVEVVNSTTVRLHIMNPNSALPYLIANLWANIVEPGYVMQHDLELWKQPNNGYSLPYPSLSGNLTTRIYQYFVDFSSTCNAGVTPKGCAMTYLDQSVQGSLAGTGPYIIQSVDTANNVITLVANPNYWGGPYGNIHPHIQKYIIKYVPSQTTREIDLQNAARSGQAMVVDITPTNIFDVVDRNSWLNQGKFVSNIAGVTVYGPYTQYATLFIPLATNVTDQFTGQYYQFQPFADIRFRLAFADSVNLTEINLTVNNKLGQVANNVLPPGIPPQGTNASLVKPRYHYDPVEVQNLLLDAMFHPITQFHFANGTIAPRGLFNNTFGCKQLNSNNQCSNPVTRTVPLVYATGDLVDEAILNQIASTIDNISSTYNMGLTVTVLPLPAGQMISQAFSGHVYAWAEAPFGWYDDYPWALDFLGPILSPGGIYTAPAGWNTAEMARYWNQALQANANGSMDALIKSINQMVTLGNKLVMDIWTFYPEIYVVATSNVHGFYFNPSLYTVGEPQYVAALY